MCVNLESSCHVLPNKRLKLPGGDRSKGSGVLCPAGHNTPLPLERSPPGSFKRLLGSTWQELSRFTHITTHGSRRPFVHIGDHSFYLPVLVPAQAFGDCQPTTAIRQCHQVTLWELTSELIGEKEARGAQPVIV